MAKLERAVRDMHIADDADHTYSRKSRVHPLSRLLVTVLYIVAVVSFSKYNFIGLAGMVLYILIQCIWFEISIKEMLKHIWFVVILMGIVGIANPLLDKRTYAVIEGIPISYGLLSMIILIAKGIFCVTASYILVRSIGIGQICYALQFLRLPEELVTILLLMHRYMIVLIKEVECMQQAYKLRASKQKGLHVRSWGSFAGLLLLRSIDRAQEVYESMKLRGFQGRMQHSSFKGSRLGSIFYVLLWSSLILLLRIYPVFRIVGNLLQ